VIVFECQALEPGASRTGFNLHHPTSASLAAPYALQQGLTLVHFSAQRQRFLWSKGCIEGIFRGCVRVVGVGGQQELYRVLFMSETAQVELRRGRVWAPALELPRKLAICACVVRGSRVASHSRSTPCKDTTRPLSTPPTAAALALGPGTAQKPRILIQMSWA
jgi:hypothetical protein